MSTECVSALINEMSNLDICSEFSHTHNTISIHG